jgi:hypothetical protein
MRILIGFSLLLGTALLSGFFGPTNFDQTTIQNRAAQSPAFQSLSFSQNSAQPSESSSNCKKRTPGSGQSAPGQHQDRQDCLCE